MKTWSNCSTHRKSMKTKSGTHKPNLPGLHSISHKLTKLYTSANRCDLRVHYKTLNLVDLTMAYIKTDYCVLILINHLQLYQNILWIEIL